jgi:glycosyltransferase involved in cell wall biosynthesis
VQGMRLLEKFLDKLRERKRRKESQKEMVRLRRDFDDLKSKLDIAPELFDAFSRDRVSEPYLAHFTRLRPLVSVCIATYNRADLLVERCLKSILGQTYENLEVIVVGDCCTDDTDRRVAVIRDTRLRFLNLERRGEYPIEKDLRWMVAGTIPVNVALEMATGDFVTHLDDDDAFLPERIEKLTNFIQANRADIVWHPFWKEKRDGRWKFLDCPEFQASNVTTSSIFYHSWFRRIPWDINAYRYREPGDWNRLRKFRYLGVKALRFPEPLLRHYKEKEQSEK